MRPCHGPILALPGFWDQEILSRLQHAVAVFSVLVAETGGTVRRGLSRPMASATTPRDSPVPVLVPALDRLARPHNQDVH